MTKNLDKQGESKSSPPEIAKLKRFACTKCGLTGPATMVRPTGKNDRGLCINAPACARRARKQGAMKP